MTDARETTRIPDKSPGIPSRPIGHQSSVIFVSEQTLKDRTEAVTLDPAPRLIFHLTRAQWLAGRRDTARESLRRAQAAGPDEIAVDPLARKAFRSHIPSLERK